MALPSLLTDANLRFALLPRALGLGSKSDNKNTGKFPVYDPNSNGDTVTLTNMASGFGLYDDGSERTINFDGNNDYLQTTYDPDFSDAGGFTISLWYYGIPDSTTNRNLFSQYVDGDNYAQFGVRSNAIFFGFELLNVNRTSVSNITLMNSGQWNHLLARKKTDGTLEIWINGTEVSYSAQATYDHGAMNLATNATIGIRNSLEYIDTKISEYIVYEKALSDSEIATLYAAGRYSTVYGYENGDGATMELFDSEQSVGQWSTYGVDILMIARQNGADQMTGNYATYPDSNDDGTPDYQLAFSGSWTAGSGYRKADRLIRFPGSPASMTTGGYHPTINDDSLFSVRARIKPTLGTLMVIASQYDSTSLRWYAWISATGQLYFYFQNATGNRTALSSTTLTDGVDADVEWRKRGSLLSLFIDGVEVSYSTRQTYDIGALAPTNPMTIGQAAAAQYLTADLYFLEIGNKALSASRRSTYAALDNWMGLSGRNENDVMVLYNNILNTHFLGLGLSKLKLINRNYYNR